MSPAPGTGEGERPLLLWDGACGFCRRCVVWALVRDREHKIRALPYQEAPSPPMTDALRARCERAVQLLYPDGTLRSAGRAVLDVLALLGWEKTARVLGAPPLVWLVEAGYRLVARHRGWLGRWL